MHNRCENIYTKITFCQVELTNAQRHSSVSPFNRMKKVEYEKECTKRKICYDGDKLEDVKAAFTEHMAGVVRVPSYRFKNPDFTFSNHYMSLFEISPAAPLHDVKGHISHVLTEIEYILEGGKYIALFEE